MLWKCIASWASPLGFRLYSLQTMSDNKTETQTLDNQVMLLCVQFSPRIWHAFSLVSRLFVTKMSENGNSVNFFNNKVFLAIQYKKSFTATTKRQSVNLNLGAYLSSFSAVCLRFGCNSLSQGNLHALTAFCGSICINNCHKNVWIYIEHLDNLYCGFMSISICCRIKQNY